MPEQITPEERAQWRAWAEAQGPEHPLGSVVLRLLDALDAAEQRGIQTAEDRDRETLRAGRAEAAHARVVKHGVVVGEAWEKALERAEADRATIRAEALAEVRREWQYGGWTILTRPPTAGGIPALDLGQRVTDWLRAREEAAQKPQEATRATERPLGATE